MEAMRALDHVGAGVEDISLRRPTLDEVFLTFTGKPAGTAGQSSGPEAA
jgi:ABC-2 type transport system ATP-binding protein